MQDTYIDKLVKNYAINTNCKASSTSLSVKFDDIKSFDEDVDQSRMHEYRKKMRSVCYSAVISRSDIAKAASKLAEHLTNPEPAHLDAVNHLIRYLYETKHLAIRYDASKNEELTANKANEKHVFEANKANKKQVFEAIADATFANEKERKSAEEYTFKLFDDLID
jgi:hypothetical protein